MTKNTPDVPAFKRHKSTGQAYASIDGKRRYFGRHDLPESRARYDVFIAEWLANGRRAKVEATDLTIVELAAAFTRHLKANDADKRDLQHCKAALEPLVALYGATAAVQFGPLALKAVRERLITCGKRSRTRGYVNRLVKQIRFIFKWAVGEEMIPVQTYEALRVVPSLARGKCDAPESAPVRPVPIEHVDAIRPYLSRQVEALIDLQLLTAARPGELLAMRPIDLDTTGAVWTYRPQSHKNAHRGHERTIFLGPKGQAIVKPFLAGRGVESYLFSPREAVTEQLERRHEERVTPEGQGNEPGTNVVADPQRPPGERYTPCSYRRAIQRACERAGVPSWHPYQLRHSAATELRKQFGLDVAQVMLGHMRCDVTQVYSEVNAGKAKAIAAKVG